MSEPQAITSDHLRALLDSSDAASILGLIEGRVEVIEGDQIGSDPYRGALTVISRGDLEERLGGETGDDELDAQAEALSTSVQELGG